MDAPLHIATAADGGYLPSLEVLVCSTLLQVRRDCEVHFHVIDGGISSEGWGRLERHATRFHPKAFVHRLSFQKERFAHLPNMKGNHLTYARLLLGECFPALDRIVYLDSDILVGRDVVELRDLDLQGRTMLAAGDVIISTLAGDCPWLPAEESEAFRYFNAGVVVIDLARWRQKNYQESCLSALASQGANCRFHDQTVMNYILRHDVAFLDQYWNQIVFASDQLPVEPAIFHLIGRKPWSIQTPRFDHYLWRAFYEDMIEPGCSWAADSSLGRKLFVHFYRWPATRWVLRLAIAIQIIFIKQQHKKSGYRETLRQGYSDFSRLPLIRAGWNRRCHELGIAPLRGE